MSLEIPIVQVDVTNILTLQSTIDAALKRCDFVAIDTEFSGLSNSRASMAKDMDERYIALREMVSTHSVIQIGLSFFIRKPNQQTDGSSGFIDYDIRTYKISTFCQENFQVSPTSLAFLSRHDFDFKYLFLYGIPYWPCDKPQDKDSDTKIPQSPLPETSMAASASLKKLISSVFMSKKPIIVHNGFLDLMFLCHSFYHVLPEKFSKFVDFVVDNIPSLYDTKYLAEYCQQENATYLQYLIRKCWCRVAKLRKSGKSHARHSYFGGYLKEEDYLTQLESRSELAVQLCERYLRSGFCPRELVCELCHDVDQILWKEEVQQKSKKRKADSAESKIAPSTEDSAQKSAKDSKCAASPSPSALSNGSHSAGFDAYATGYIFACYQHLMADSIHESTNKLYLMGKRFPLWLQRSKFSSA
eukprot:TRINITY_DN6545_c0_g2_i3.p1 TRINITY_DN6545_c0_g2~~TRINITY_DN6545_c0_g2_i3.p1  ORF type:complete len:415 (+),score=92.22 TRINITY_DN6545_c0_g2_i3:66-1310(+)